MTDAQAKTREIAAAGEDRDVGQTLVRHLEDGDSFWQPVPANGFVRCLLNSRQVDAHTRFSMGTQTVAPGGCYVRRHSHDRHEEIIFFLSGEGRIELDDGAEEHPAKMGTTVFLGRNRRHSFINDGDEPLTFVWFLMPGGLEDFFRMIGRPRQPGDEAPAPFPRPDDVEAIEKKTVFAAPT